MKMLIISASILLGSFSQAATLSENCKLAVTDYYRHNAFAAVSRVQVAYEGLKYSVVQYEMISATGEKAIFEASVDSNSCKILATSAVGSSEN